MTEITLTRADITTLEVDVIVNAANRGLLPGGGVDGAIRAAGGPVITAETSAIGPVDTGQAAATAAGRLRARHVIHTVGPVWGEAPESDSDELLGSCYRSCLSLAAELDANSIAFPNISTGVYGFPIQRAAAIATDSVRKWLRANPTPIQDVVFVCFEEESYRIYRELLGL